VSVFPFIEAEKAEQHDTVKRSCVLLEVSRSAFYEWHQHIPSARQLADDDLGERILEIFDESRGTYGWPRVHQALRDDGVCVRRERVARIMRTKGLVGRCRRRWIKTTISDPDVVAVDLLKRTFGRGTVELEHDMIQSLSRPRQCWDNAVAESFFASLKLECVYRQALPTRAHTAALQHS
jgi:transposase InsO family protein